MMGAFKIRWIDSHREPRCPPNPAYPKGVDIVAAHPDLPSCRTDLPYPARRCGYYAVECATCGTKTVVTTAGRPDDPRSLTIECKRRVVH